MEEKRWRPIKPENCLSLKRKKLQNIQITTQRDQTRQGDKPKDCAQKNETVHNLTWGFSYTDFGTA